MRFRLDLPGSQKAPETLVRGFRNGILSAPEKCASVLLTVLAAVYCIGYFVMARAMATPIGLTYRIFQGAGLFAFISNHSRVTAVASSMCMIISYLLLGHGWTATEWSHVPVSVLIYLICTTAFLAAVQPGNDMPDTLEEIGRRVGQRWPETWFRTRLRKSCDAYFTRFVLNTAVRALPGVCLLLSVDFRFLDSFFVVAFYFLSQSVAAPGVELIDHTDIHNGIFRSRRDCTLAEKTVVGILRNGWTYVLAPLCLRIPNFYRVQHLYVHHVENNGSFDNQSTLPYDRASFIDFCIFAFKLGISLSFAVDVSIYLIGRSKRRPLRQLWAGMLIWYGGLGLISLFNWEAAIIMWAARFLGGGIFAASTAFSWHGLVDIDEPENIYKNSINAALPDAHGSFGSALHVEHHISPGCHWTELQIRASGNESRHMAFGAVELWGFEWFGSPLLAAFWMKRFDLIASYCLRIGGYGAELGDLAATIESRTRPWNRTRRTGMPRRIDEILGRVVAKYLVGAVSGASEQDLAQIQCEIAAREEMLLRRMPAQ